MFVDLTENGANAVSKDSIDSSKKRPHSNSPDKATGMDYSLWAKDVL